MGDASVQAWSGPMQEACSGGGTRTCTGSLLAPERASLLVPEAAAENGLVPLCHQVGAAFNTSPKDT